MSLFKISECIGVVTRLLTLIVSPVIVCVLPVVAQSAGMPVKISALVHLTGEYAQVGKAFREGIVLAEEEVNKNGGVHGRLLKIIFDDTQYNMRTVNSLAHKAISLDKVPLALISNYTEVMVAGPAFDKAKVPLITIWDSSPEIEKLGRYIFGIGIWSPSSAIVGAEYAVNTLNVKTVAVVSTNGQWSLNVAEKFKEQFSEHGGQVVDSYSVNPGDTDFRTIVTKIAKLNPDMIYAPLSDHLVSFWQQVGHSGYAGLRMTSDILNKELIGELGVVSEGIYQTQMMDPSNLVTKKMLQAYKDKYGKKCGQVFYTALGYDGVKLAAEAIKNAKNLSSEEITKALYAIKNFPGGTGQISIDQNGSARKETSMFVVKGKRLVLSD